MRSSELLGRSGKQADGTAKTREVKLVTVWSAESQDELSQVSWQRTFMPYNRQ
jgi:hypothetical protein